MGRGSVKQSGNVLYDAPVPRRLSPMVLSSATVYALESAKQTILDDLRVHRRMLDKRLVAKSKDIDQDFVPQRSSHFYTVNFIDRFRPIVEQVYEQLVNDPQPSFSMPVEEVAAYHLTNLAKDWFPEDDPEHANVDFELQRLNERSLGNDLVIELWNPRFAKDSDDDIAANLGTRSILPTRGWFEPFAEERY